MSITFVDRESTSPNRFLVTPENGGSPYYIVLERADEPTVTGTPLNAETFNQLIADLTAMAEDAGIPLPSTATVGQYIRVKTVDSNGQITATESAEAVTEIPAVTSIGMVQNDGTITMSVGYEGGATVESVITLDSDGYPTTIVTDGVSCTVTWEGF